jgi:multicomponent Na+:H+ antiporter subunit A
LIAAASIIGIPLTNGFVAKWLLLDAALNANLPIVVVVAWLVSVITAIYMLKATVSVFYGEEPEWLKATKVHDAEPSMLVGLGILGSLCLVFGIAPQLLFRSLVTPAVNALGFSQDVSLTWFGLQTSSAGVQVTLGAAIAVITVLIGWMVFALVQPRAQKTNAGVFTGGDPMPLNGGMNAEDFTVLAETTLAPVYAVTNPDRVYFPLWQTIKKAAAWLGKVLAPLSEKYAVVATVVLALIVFVVVWLG